MALDRPVRTVMLASLGAVALVGAGSAVAATHHATAKTQTITVTLGKPSEMTMSLKPSSVKAGRVTFKVTNHGKLVHEAIVIRTNLAPNKLETKGAVAVFSKKSQVAATGHLKAGKSKTITATLKKGKYVVICNLPGHYLAGMRAGLTVR